MAKRANQLLRQQENKKYIVMRLLFIAILAFFMFSCIFSAYFVFINFGFDI